MLSLILPRLAILCTGEKCKHGKQVEFHLMLLIHLLLKCISYVPLKWMFYNFHTLQNKFVIPKIKIFNIIISKELIDHRY